MELRTLDARRPGTSRKTCRSDVFNNIQEVDCSDTIANESRSVTASEYLKRSETVPQPTSKTNSIRRSMMFCCCSSQESEESGDDLDGSYIKKQNDDHLVHNQVEQNHDLVKRREMRMNDLEYLVEHLVEKVENLDPAFKVVGPNYQFRRDRKPRGLYFQSLVR